MCLDRRIATRCLLGLTLTVTAMLAPGFSRAQSVSEVLLTAMDTLRGRFPHTVVTHIRLVDREVVQTWQVLGPRRLRFVQSPPEHVPELIVWEDNAYLREAAGWYRKSLNTTPIDLGGNDWMPIALGRTLTGATQLPDTELAGTPTRHYAAEVRYEDALGIYAGHFELWLDAALSLPLRSTFEGSHGGHPLRIDSRIDYLEVPPLAPPTPVLNPL